MKYVVSFFCGVLFAAGLCISGMTSPSRIIGFLDVEAWDPSLLFVMLGAIPVMFAGWRLRARMERPIAAPAFPEMPAQRLDARLFGGAALFGVGWGLGGYCPGPMLTAAGGAARPVLILLPSMLAGMLLFQLLERRRTAPAIQGRVPETASADPAE